MLERLAGMDNPGRERPEFLDSLDGARREVAAPRAPSYRDEPWPEGVGNNRSAEWPGAQYHPAVLFAFCYFVLRALLRIATDDARESEARDLGAASSARGLEAVEPPAAPASAGPDGDAALAPMRLQPPLTDQVGRDPE